MKVVLSACLVALFAGCAVPPPQRVQRMPFPEAEYAALKVSGSATVSGQAFLKTRGGDVKTAAGNPVYLNPVTSYSLEWHEKGYYQNQNIGNSDPRLERYMKVQTADGSGRFVFKSVPAGEYFVTTKVTWEAPTGYQGRLESQGGLVTKRIAVADGEAVEVIVTR